MTKTRHHPDTCGVCKHIEEDTRNTSMKFPLQEPLMSTIVPGHLYVGNDSTARNENLLRLHGVKNIIDLRTVELDPPPEFEGITRYKFEMIDGPGNANGIFQEAMDCLHSVVDHAPTLVNCLMGQSRSVSLVTAFWGLTCIPQISFGEALAAIKALHPQANPNPFTAQMARDYMKQVGD